MSTRSLIAKYNNDGLISCIYCHHDGYLDWVGKILVENYDTENKITELFKLGNLSSLDVTPEKCTAYHRDYNENYDDVKPKLFRDESKLIGYFLNSDCEYLYLFDSATKTWLYYNYKQSKFLSVANELSNKN